MRVLIVDENSTTADVVRFNLERKSVDVAVAHDGDTGWTLFQGEQFDCVIVEHTLAGIDGDELCRRIRKQNDNIPIILLTGRILEPSIMALYERLNIYKSVPKPFSPREIVALVLAATGAESDD